MRDRTFLGLMTAQIVTALGALAVNVMAARALGPEGRGEMALILQLSYLIGAGSILGRDVAFPASTDNLPPRARRIARLVVVPAAAGTVVGALVGGAVPSSADRVAVAAALAALVAGNLFTRALRTYAICARSEAVFVGAVVVSQVAATSGAAALMLRGNSNSEAWLAAYGAAILVPSLVALLAVRMREPRCEHGALSHGRLSAATLGLRLLPAYLFDFVSSRLDRLVLPLLAGYAQLGIYTVIATMTELTIWPVRQYVDSCVPKWKKLHDRNAVNLSRVFTRGLAFLTVASLLVGVATYALAVPLYGAEYSGGLVLVVPLTLAVFAHGLVIVALGLATATARTKLAGTVGISSFAVSALLYLLLIPGWGAMGAAIGLLGGYALASAVAIIGLLASGKDNTTDRRADNVTPQNVTARNVTAPEAFSSSTKSEGSG